MKFFVVASLFLFSINSLASFETHTFKDKTQEKLYVKLTEELRCLVCQNQNIAGSNAELATDLREKTYSLIQQGKNETEIKKWMTDRYGDFVLYKPQFKLETLLLWLGPGILFFIAFFVVIRIASKNGKGKQEIDLGQQQKINDLMNQEGKQ